MRRINGKAIAATIDSEGAAAQKGMRDNDEIVSVNGIPASKLSLAQIRRLWSKPDVDRLTISFHRNATETAIVLDLPQERVPFPTAPDPETVNSIDDR